PVSDDRPTAVGRRGATGRLCAAGLCGYLLGTFPSSGLATNLAADGHDLLTEGSGNPGAANAAQVLGRRWGLAVLVSDVAKGALAGVVGRSLAGDNGAYLGATTAIAGHVVPVWRRGRGGKGVATSAGATLAVFPVYFPVDLAVTLVGALRHRRAEAATRLACAVWVGTAVASWRLRWPNGWGPDPGPGLPLFATVGSALVLAAFVRGRSRGVTA
ncbi:MAG TPA: glycerol-3-phosphate acyltransferase, partial [Acidimicrobiales bacterium]|nr:glycerol-3-phosphate acyltransferase [Acidimicrobiales bacterium]